jgi:hypothetical protein
MNKMLESSDKDFTEAIIKMFQQSFTNSLETTEETKNLSKEKEIIKKTQMEIMKLKNTRTTI